ncbi:MAG: hypothetical protein ACP5GA_08980, partial [Acidithiobacillus sp.]
NEDYDGDIDMDTIEGYQQLKAMTTDCWEQTQYRREVRTLEESIVFCDNSVKVIQHALEEFGLPFLFPSKKRYLARGLVIGNYYEGGHVYHLINGNHLCPDIELPGHFIEENWNDLGFFIDVPFCAPAGDRHLWLYCPGSEPWTSRENALEYVMKLQRLKTELVHRLETIRKPGYGQTRPPEETEPCG